MKSFTTFLLAGLLTTTALVGQGVGGNSVPRTATGISNALDLLGSTQGQVAYRGAAGWVVLAPGTSGQLLSSQGAAADPIWVTATGGAGDMNGPASATDNAIVRFDGTGGKTGQNSAVTIADTTGDIAGASSLTAPASTDLTLSGGNTGASLVLGKGASANAVVNVLSSSPADPQSSAFRVAVGTNQLNLGNNTTGNGYSFIQSVKTGAAWTPLVLQAAAGGNVLIGTTTDAAGLAGGLVVNGSGAGAAASSTTTGALRVTGGVGVSGAGYFGGNVVSNSGSNPIFSAAISGTSIGSFSAFGADVYIGVDQNANGNMIFRRNSATESMRITGSNGAVNITSTVSASASNVGALTIGNGTAATNVAIGGGNINAGGTGTFAGAVTHTLGTNLPPQTAPASPASGWTLYTDSGDGNKLKAKASTGTVITIGTP